MGCILDSLLPLEGPRCCAPECNRNEDWTEFKSHRRSRGAELQKESMTEALMCEVWKKKTEKEKDVPD